MLTPSDLDTVHQLLSENFHVYAQVLTEIQMRRELDNTDLAPEQIKRMEAHWLTEINHLIGRITTVRRILERSMKR